MKIVISKEVPSIIIITLFICIMMVLMANSVKKLSINQKPKGLALIGILIVDTFEKLVKTNMDEKALKNFAPYITSIALYILFSNISGLTGFLTPPTSSLSITFSLAFLTWILIEITALKTQGFFGFIKGLFEPFFLFFIPNFFGHISPLISMSMRLFGNILAGGIIMSLTYWACLNLSNLILGLVNLGGFNFMAVFITPVLHMYFDLFSGIMQMFVFISLTMVLIQKEK